MIGSATSSWKIGLYLGGLLWLLTLAIHPTGAQTKLVAFEEDGKWGYKNASGQVVIKPRFHMANDFLPEGIAAVTDDRGWGYIDTKGRVVIRPFVFDNGPDYFREGLARFELRGKFGFFDKKGSGRFTLNSTLPCRSKGTCRRYVWGAHNGVLGNIPP
jgi:hypothetical protein